MTNKECELREFALDVLWQLAKTTNGQIADMCHDLLRLTLADTASTDEIKIDPDRPVLSSSPADLNTDISGCLSLSEVSSLTGIYKQWLCNWATRHPDSVKRKGFQRWWPKEAVEAVKYDYFHHPSIPKKELKERVSAEAEAGVAEDGDKSGDEKECGGAGGKTLLDEPFKYILSGRKGRYKGGTWRDAVKYTGLSLRQLEVVCFYKEIINGWLVITEG